MLDELAFVQAVAANPDDDGPRLMFADFLEERGDVASIVRAEFIRVQCAIARQINTSDVLEKLWEREANLLEANWRIWLRPICQALGEPLPVASSQRTLSGEGPPERHSLQWLETARQAHMVHQPWTGRESAYFYYGQFRRGFFSHAALVAKPYRGPQHVARLVERTPIDGLTLVQYPMRELCATIEASQPKQLRSLELLFPDGDGLQAITRLKDLDNLRELMIRSVRNNADIVLTLVHGTIFDHLKLLSLNSCYIDEVSLLELARRPWVANLERLELVHCGLTDRHAQILIERFPSSNLTHLDLSANRFTNQGWKELFKRFGSIMASSIAERPWPERFYL
jgi:uncharacterized protein (TIGR02996 family)